MKLGMGKKSATQKDFFSRVDLKILGRRFVASLGGEFYIFGQDFASNHQVAILYECIFLGLKSRNGFDQREPRFKKSVDPKKKHLRQS